MRGRAIPFLALTTLWLHGVLAAQAPLPATRSLAPGPLKLDTGKEIFRGGLHRLPWSRRPGQPQTTLGFEPPATFPDFSDCNGSTRERTYDWRAAIHEGRPGPRIFRDHAVVRRGADASIRSTR